MNQNRSNSIQTANTNIQTGVADYNSKLNASIGAEAQKAAEYASLVNNRNTKLEEFTKSEKLNDREYNKKINAIMATVEGQRAYKDYANSANDAANIAERQLRRLCLPFNESLSNGISSVSGTST